MRDARLIHLAPPACAVLLLCLLGLHAPAVAQPAPPGRAPAQLDTTNGCLIARSLPRVVYRGGPFLRRPRVVTVTFKGDDPRLVSRLEQFGALITRTRWWREVTEGYCANGECIGRGRPAVSVRLAQPLPAAMRDVDVEALLARQAEVGRFGALDANTLLLVYLPASVTLSDAFVPRYCNRSPRAFHRALKLGKTKLAYAVLPRCSNEEAELTATASHEILEAATNPDPSARGFAFERSSANAGFTAAGVEPVDPCGLITMNNHRTIESGFVVQRAWSNRQVSLGRDPCVPSKAGAYVALVPRQPTVRLAHVGDSETIPLDAAADRIVPAWAVAALAVTEGQEREPCVEISVDRTKVSIGETANLTITRRQPNTNRLCIVSIVSTLGGESSVWPLAVVMR